MNEKPWKFLSFFTCMEYQLWLSGDIADFTSMTLPGVHSLSHKYNSTWGTLCLPIISRAWLCLGYTLPAHYLTSITPPSVQSTCSLCHEYNCTWGTFIISWAWLCLGYTLPAHNLTCIIKDAQINYFAILNSTIYETVFVFYTVKTCVDSPKTDTMVQWCCKPPQN